MIRPCTPIDFAQIWTIINDGAESYRGVIPPDCLSDPYMSPDHLQRDIDAGVQFWGDEELGNLRAVMGIQHILDVTLIRHAYVLTGSQKQGLGTGLLHHLRASTDRPILIGTWATATWAIHFYQRHGFHLVDTATTDRLLRTYWTVPERQIASSVVLADRPWLPIAITPPTRDIPHRG